MKDQDSSVDQDKLTVKQALRRFIPKYLVLWGHSVFITLLAFMPFLYLKQVMTRVYDSRSWETLVFLTVIVVFAVVVMRVLHFFRAGALAGIGEQINEQLRSKIFTVVHERGERDSFRYFGDVATLRNGLTGGFIASAMDASLSPLFIGVMYLLHPVLGIAAICFIAVIGIVSFFKARKIKSIKAEVKPLEDEAFAFGLASASKHNAIRSMNLLPGLRRKWLEMQSKASNVSVEGQRPVEFYDAILGFLRASEIVLIVGLSAVLYLLDEITADVGFAAFIIMMRGVTPILAIVQNWGTIEETRSAYARLEKLLSEADDAKRIAPNDLVGELTCENLGFLAEGGRPILQGIGFRVPAGSILGVIGPSGAGKSTLLQLLAGASDTKLGTVKVDGFPLSQWPHEVIGSVRGYLPQSVDLLPGTIWENVARFQPYSEENNERVIAAMECIDALPIAQAKPGGLSFLLGEDGTPLSGGQRQRIGLARAFYGNPKLIILDEPNSALDAEGEAALARAISEQKRKGSTVVFSTHKASMLEMCDYLLVVMNGYMHSFSGKDDILDRIQASGNKLIEADDGVR